jgi:hypothetical protein
MKIVIKLARISFANGLFTPKAGEDGGEAKFSSAFIIPKDHPQVAEITAAMKEVAKEKWGAKADAIYTELKSANKLALHDGDTKASLDGYAGNLFLNGTNRSRPTVLDRDKTPLTQADGKPYSGSYVNVSLDLWAMDNKFGRRINAQLLAVQFAKDGDSFGGGAAFEDNDFEVVEADDLF